MIFSAHRCGEKLPLAALDNDMQAALKALPDEKGKAGMFGEPGYQRDIMNKLTTDGCHMNANGNIMMAKGTVKALGPGNDKIAGTEKSWQGR